MKKNQNSFNIIVYSDVHGNFYALNALRKTEYYNSANLKAKLFSSWFN